jgi:hypothetical protein
LSEALSTAHLVTYVRDRVWVLTQIAKTAPQTQQGGLFTEILALARGIPIPTDRFFAIHSMIEYLDGDQQHQAITDALAAARSDDFDGPRSYALSEIARLLAAEEAAELMREAISAARQHPDERERPMFLAEISARLPATPERRSLLREAIAIARSTDTDQILARRVALRIAEFLPESMLLKGLAAVREFARGDGVTDSVAEVLRQLPSYLLQEGIEAVNDLPSPVHRAQILGTLAPHLAPGPRQTALNYLFVDSSQILGRRALMTQTNRLWKDQVGATEIDILRRCLDGTDLDDCLDVLAAGFDLVYAIGRDQAVHGCLRAIRSVQRWWPRFADQAAI